MGGAWRIGRAYLPAHLQGKGKLCPRPQGRAGWGCSGPLRGCGLP